MSSVDADGLTGLLARLLTDDDLRRRLRTDGPEAVAGSAGERECLATVDVTELDFTVRRLRSQLWTGSGGGIVATFPRTVERLRSVGWTRDRLLPEFVAAPEFSQYRELPYTGPGLSLEESFALFVMRLVGSSDKAERCVDCGRRGCAITQTAEHELLTRLLTALVHEHPVSFRVLAAGIVRSERGRAALRTYCGVRVSEWRNTDDPSPGPVLCGYFATSAAFAFGPVTPRVAAAVQGEATAAAGAARASLRARGLW